MANSFFNPSVEGNSFFKPAEATGPTVDFLPLFRSVSTDEHKKEMQAALAEYDELNAGSRDLAIPHKAEACREWLKNRKINIPGNDDHFRGIYLEGRDHATRESDGILIDDQIVSRLEKRATLVVYKIKTAALAVLEQATPVYPRADAALAERLGLPEWVIWSPLHNIVRKAQDQLRAELSSPVVLRNGAPRRAVLESYFK